MEAALLSGFLNIILTKLVSMAEKNYKLLRGMRGDMEFLERELRAISSVVQGQHYSESNSLRPDQKQLIEDLSTLAYQIEDGIDTLTYHAVQRHHVTRMGKFFDVKWKKILLKLANDLKTLKTRPAEDHERSNRYTALQPPTDTETPSSSSTQRMHEAPPKYVRGLVGIDGVKKELREHLAADAEGKLKVISIIGFPGSGKTVLAWALYNSEEIVQQFGLHAWVHAAQPKAQELLVNILQELDKIGESQTLQDTSNGDHQPVADIIRQHHQPVADIIRQRLMNKRYLIVIDDMRTDVWRDIESAFPQDDRLSSRIIVTTTVQTVAKASNIANINVHVHKMGKLNDENSKQLFVNYACPVDYSDYPHPDSERILQKCDGQALALVTVGQLLGKNGWPTDRRCDRACQLLRHCLLEQDQTLERMRQKLMHSYACVPSYAPNAFLMYFAMFPSNHPIRRKILMRLWLAEGFMEPKPSRRPQELAQDNFKMLIEHSIIEPVDVSNNTDVKTCKTYGMMGEFISIKCMSQGFVVLRGDEKLETTPKHVRRLCFYNSSATDDKNLVQNVKVIRSLTVYGRASQAILEFKKYELLKILDLEGCTAELGNDGLKGICNLFLLKYLSLGGTVTSLPNEIKNLRLLETLDLRKSNISILPTEVILLPSLIHLFGKFRLPSNVKTSKLKECMSAGPSSLETLAGFIMGECQAFDMIMCYMKNLSKVEIWCEGTMSITDHTQLKKAIQQFIKDTKDRSDARSLSLHGRQLSTKLLDDIEAKDCYLKSLKLGGILTTLPKFVLSLRGLTELQLESSEGMTTNVLTKLGDLKELQYLKLKADHLEEFIIKKGESFPKLLRLCLILERPTLPMIMEDGALKYLASLLVICKKLVGLSGMRIQYLRALTNVTLDEDVIPGTKSEWQIAATQHPRKPKILFISNDDATATEDSVSSGPAESASTEYLDVSARPAQESETQILLNPGTRYSSSS